MKKFRMFRVYGLDGHRQRESFNKSCIYDDIHIYNSDVTGTNLYSEVIIYGSSDDEIFKKLVGTLSDGVFENCRTGKIVEVRIKCFDCFYEMPVKEFSIY